MFAKLVLEISAKFLWHRMMMYYTMTEVVTQVHITSILFTYTYALCAASMHLYNFVTRQLVFKKKKNLTVDTIVDGNKVHTWKFNPTLSLCSYVIKATLHCIGDKNLLALSDVFTRLFYR